MPFFLLLPASVPSGPFSWETLPRHLMPVIVPHGHGSDGRYGVCGILRHPDLEANADRFSHALGIQLVKRGHMVLCPDARGSGDRRLKKGDGKDYLLSSDCNDLNNALVSLGSCLTGAWVWDLMALADLLEEKGWTRGLTVCGFSGGGLQSLYFAALDSRVKACAASGYLFKNEDCLLDSNLCGCNFIPGFVGEMDMAAVAALIAPRALIIERGTEDPLNGRRGIAGPRELVREIGASFAAAGSSEAFQYSEFQGPHRFDGKAVYPFLEEQWGLSLGVHKN